TCAAPTEVACRCSAMWSAPIPPLQQPLVSPKPPPITGSTPPDEMDLLALLDDYTLRIVALGSALLGVVSGGLGSLAVLRRQSLRGHAIYHAALPGIVLAYLLPGSKATLVLVLGAAIAGWIGTLVVIGIVRHYRVKEDSALGLVLSVFFGFGMVLLTYVQ